MGRMCVARHRNIWCKELEECGIKWGRMAGNFEEGQGPQRAVAPMNNNNNILFLLQWNSFAEIFYFYFLEALEILLYYNKA
jgi:hypothetical protein